MMEKQRDKSLDKLAYAVGCVGLTYLGFEYDSTWAFVGAIILFFSLG